MISINATVILTVLNFILLIAVLSAILWKPMLKFLEERADKIDRSLKLAEQNKRRAEEIQLEHDQILKEARVKATEIVDKALSIASSESKVQLDQAKQQAHNIVESARNEILMEAEKIKSELRQEVAAMTIDLAGKVLSREIKPEDHRELISKNLDTMGS